MLRPACQFTKLNTAVSMIGEANAVTEPYACLRFHAQAAQHAGNHLRAQ